MYGWICQRNFKSLTTILEIEVTSSMEIGHGKLGVKLTTPDGRAQLQLT